MELSRSGPSLSGGDTHSTACRTPQCSTRMERKKDGSLGVKYYLKQKLELKDTFVLWIPIDFVRIGIQILLFMFIGIQILILMFTWIRIRLWSRTGYDFFRIWTQLGLLKLSSSPTFYLSKNVIFGSQVLF